MTNKNVYVWGAGHYGVLTALDSERKNVKITGFIDSNASKIKSRFGLPVLSPQDAIDNKSIHVIIAICDVGALKEITDYLKSCEVDFEISDNVKKIIDQTDTDRAVRILDNTYNINTFPNLLDNYITKSDNELDTFIKNSFSNLTDNCNVNTLALQAYESLQDNESRRLYAYLYLLNIIKLTGLPAYQIQHGIPLETLKNRLMEKGNDLNNYNIYNRVFFFDKQYFYLQNKEYMTTANNEIFVDCGAFDGGTIKDFIEYCDGKYDKIYSFEPMPNQYNDTLKNINDSKIERVELIKKGVWNYNTTFNFKEASSGSRISKNGTIPVEVVPIDEVIPNNENVTFIKMDIEGAEYEALQGATKTIRRCKPKLAICIYHKPQDIIEIPILIKSILPEYKFYIRHHSVSMDETVLYAFVPWE